MGFWDFLGLIANACESDHNSGKCPDCGGKMRQTTNPGFSHPDMNSDEREAFKEHDRMECKDCSYGYDI